MHRNSCGPSTREYQGTKALHTNQLSGGSKRTRATICCQRQLDLSATSLLPCPADTAFGFSSESEILEAGARVVYCVHIHVLPVKLHGHQWSLLSILILYYPPLPKRRQERTWPNSVGKRYSSSASPSKQDTVF